MEGCTHIMGKGKIDGNQYTPPSVKVLRINPDFRIFACQKVHYFFIFPIELAKFEGFQDFWKILLAPMHPFVDSVTYTIISYHE